VHEEVSKYRPDIDGLRAIAILTVVGFHALPKALPGGFIGVDVFFVISGYRIGSIVLSQIDAGQFSILAFYARRVRRIFPALISVLTVSLVAAWLFLLPDQFETFGQHLFASSLFTANISLWKQAGYFAPEADTVPLLHLWSLGIEEQFYLLWPVAAMFFLPFGRRVSISAAITSIVLSFIVSLLWGLRHESDVFYLPQFRAWELFVGVALASVVLWWPSLIDFRLKKRPHAAEVASALGLALIIFSVLCYDSRDVYPSWRALLPVAGASLIIAAGANSRANRILLAHPFAVGLGLISYPLYLWHWPLLVFGNIVGLVSPSFRAILVAVAVILAWGTYSQIERPLRRSSLRSAGMLLAGMAALGCGGLLVYSGLIGSNTATPEMKSISAAVSDFIGPQGRTTPVRSGHSGFWRAAEGPETVFMLGDSNMEQYYPRVLALLESGQARKSVLFAVHGGCPPIPHISSPQHLFCPSFMQDAFNYALEHSEIQTIVVAAQWSSYFENPLYKIDADGQSFPLNSKQGKQAAFRLLANELHRLRRAGKSIYLVLNIPIGPSYGPLARVHRTSWGTPILTPPPKPQLKDFLSHYSDVRDGLIEVGRELNIQVIDPLEYLCHAGTCLTADSDGIPAYKDGSHLRATFVREHVNYLDQVFAPPKIRALATPD
jgi:peptidoglycan/LPS O-acetylase OafA/YrhL